MVAGVGDSPEIRRLELILNMKSTTCSRPDVPGAGGETHSNWQNDEEHTGTVQSHVPHPAQAARHRPRRPARTVLILSPATSATLPIDARCLRAAFRHVKQLDGSVVRPNLYTRTAEFPPAACPDPPSLSARDQSTAQETAAVCGITRPRVTVSRTRSELLALHPPSPKIPSASGTARRIPHRTSAFRAHAPRSCIRAGEGWRASCQCGSTAVAARGDRRTPSRFPAAPAQ